MKVDVKRRKLALGLSALSFAGAYPGLAFAQEKWPARPIKLLVGFPPGGGADAMARLIASRLPDRLGQPLIVDNRIGATGTICSELVARAPPDGYTLQLAHINSNAIGPLLVAKGRFDPINDFTPIALLGITPQMLAHHPKHKFANVPGLISYAKANPGKLSFASSGVGSIQHIAAEAFKLQAGVDMLHVPFKGTGEAAPGSRRGSQLRNARAVRRVLDEGNREIQEIDRGREDRGVTWIVIRSPSSGPVRSASHLPSVFRMSRAWRSSRATSSARTT